MKLPHNPHNIREHMPREVPLKNLQTVGAIILTEYHMAYAHNVDRLKTATKTVYITFSNN